MCRRLQLTVSDSRERKGGGELRACKLQYISRIGDRARRASSFLSRDFEYPPNNLFHWLLYLSDRELADR